MLFNSYLFIFAFLPLVLLGWWVVFRRPRQRLGFLAIASWIFYSAFQFPLGLMLLPLLLVSTTVDYVAGGYINRSDDERFRKRVLIAALVFNLGLLCIFKYLGFFTTTINALLGTTGIGDGSYFQVLHVVLPIGISFYTFNSMSYTIDIFRRRVQPARSLLEYSAFVALFPHLIAGPIVRYSDIDSQLRNLQAKLTSRMAGIGITFFVVGLAKKLIIADQLSPTVDRLFIHAPQLGLVSAWAAALGYSLQLYFDFSGYSDMAVGLAMLLGFRFPQNFDSPYKAVNVSDFWRRWHMSLSRWLRDYVFIPLGGSRHGAAKTLRNLYITMFVGGLWHGAAWAFVLWGMCHGLMLVIHSLLAAKGWVPRSRWVARAITFFAVVVLWVPFRAGSLPHSMTVTGDMLAGMFGLHGVGMSQVVRGADAGALIAPAFLGLIAALIVFVNIAPNTWQMKLVPSRRRAVALSVAGAWCLLLMTAPSPFLYFQF